LDLRNVEVTGAWRKLNIKSFVTLYYNFFGGERLLKKWTTASMEK
jgi:hypothetical protein